MILIRRAKMISLRKCQLFFGLAILLVCTAAICQEPNEGKVQLQFEISREEQRWIVDRGFGRGPIRPTHVAVLSIRHTQDFPEFDSPKAIEGILSTSAGKSLSQKQVDLLSTGTNCISRMGRFGDTVRNRYRFRLYAVTKEDAQRMAKVFIEFLTSEAEKKTQCYRDAVAELELLITETKEQLARKEAEAKDVDTKFKEMQKTARFLSGEEAKNLIVKLNETLNELDIKIAGLQAKIAAAEKYRSEADDNDVKKRLGEMIQQYAIELAGAMAEKESGTKIRNQAGQFYNLHELQRKLPAEVRGLKDNLLSNERVLLQNEERLNNQERLPPQIYQNKVTIYPVRVEE